MAKFPKEIWSKVFTQLTLCERLECKLVCREWWLFIDDACFLHSVEIKNSVNMFNSFINMINSSPDRAGYIKELTLDNCLDVGFNKRTLCNIFRNVRLLQVTYKEIYEYRTRYRPFTASVEMAHLQPTLESLTDSFHLELASQVLTSNLGGRLHTLVLQDTSSIPTTLLCEIQNLSVLKSLTLSRFAIEIATMERIHQKVPSIQKLNLQDIYLKDGNMSSTEIIPASVTNFDISIGYAGTLETRIQWYQYMMKKYINATSTKLGDKAPYSDHEDTQNVYPEIILPFIRQIGPTLTKLHLCKIPDIINIFAELDSVGAKIDEFELLYSDNQTVIADLSRSNQAQYITKFGLAHTPVMSIDLLKNIPKLTVVSIQTLRNVNIVKLLNVLPNTIKEFRLKCNSILFNSACTDKPLITSLHLHCIKINLEFERFIPQCLLNLVNLALQQATISLPDGNKFGFVVNNSNEIEYYPCYRGVNRVERSSLGGLPCLTVTTWRSSESGISDYEFSHTYQDMKYIYFDDLSGYI